MAHYKANANMIQKLSPEDKLSLLSIYQHRCLDEALLRQYIYTHEGTQGCSVAEQIDLLAEYRLLEKVDYNQQYPALFLTTLGVETVKTIFSDELEGLYRFENGKKALPLSSALKMHPKIINHQMHLNSFAMELESYAKRKGFFRYFDEKFMPPASNFLMPDGMAELQDCYIFLEMDMGTEAGGRLAQKWNSYRTFLNAPKGFYQRKPVVMLFILDGVKNVNLRKRNIASGLLTHIADRINGRFEVYIGGVESLHKIVKANLLECQNGLSEQINPVCADIQNTHKFLISNPSFLKQLDNPYAFYIRNLNKDGRISVIDGRPQEFLLDIWLDGRLSVLRNFLYYQRSLMQVEKSVGRKIPYLIVVPSIKDACFIIKTTGIYQVPEIFFTTPDRLSTKSWPEALFCIDQLGNLEHFKDKSLYATVHERRLKKI